MSVKALVVVALLTVACDDDPCEVPDRTLYSCEPLPAGSVGCAGGPTWTPYSGGGPRREDPDLVFPEGCVAEVPECGAYYPGRRKFECSGGRWGEPL